MNNLAFNHAKTPFSFLQKPTKSYHSNGCNLAWITNQFHLQGNNYYLYSCPVCPEIQIQKGKQPKEVLNWGGFDV